MSRLILFLIMLAVVYWVIKRTFFPGKGRTGKLDETGEELVQDPFCQCYIPKSQSYAVSLQGKKFFFCNEDCYKKYLASRALPKS
jgi:YHS domain-containing protein